MKDTHRMPSTARKIIAAATMFLTASAALPQGAFALDAKDKKELGEFIREYLVANPEILLEAQQSLKKKQQEEQLRQAEAAIAGNKEAIFQSVHDVTLGNPKGDVTIVEFYDYNCGYCKRAMQDMLDLMKSDPKVRVVLKEFPVLGQGSIEAAQVAIAVRMQDASGKKYLDFHQKLLNSRGQIDKAKALAAAKETGLDMARLEKDMAGAEIKATLEENFRIAEDMGLNGTPSYVIGKQIVIGAVGAESLKEKIGIARCGKATC